jgi:hypothetical protein
LLVEVAAPPGLPIILAIKNELRRIYERSLVAPGDESLSVREFGLRKAIFSPNVVPVVDVESKRNRLLRTYSMASKAVQPTFGRKGTVAAFGCVELKQGDALFAAFRSAFSCVRRERQCHNR